MKTPLRAAVLATAAALAIEGAGQGPVITSIHSNGRVAWTNAVNTNAIYRAEWAARAAGPWHAFTYQPIHTIDAHGSTSFEIEVPMFYRIVMITNQPPQGMVWIDGGAVELGQAGIDTPVHTNFISGFWMDEMEVRKSLWAEVGIWALMNGYGLDNAGYGKADNHPITTVNWYDAVKWCNARSQREGRRPCYYTNASHTVIYKTGRMALGSVEVDWNADGYRLPTEAEWEKAARGGRQRRLFPWGGDTIQHAQANYNATNMFAYDVSPTQGYHPAFNDGVQPYTSPVGSFAANGYGLHDMAGNVFEWCWDWYADYTTNGEADPRGPAAGQYGVYRIIRGGTWALWAPLSRCADRYFAYQHDAGATIGFRCVRGP